LAAIGLAVFGASAASASTVSFSADIFSPPGSETSVPWSTSVLLPRFDQTDPNPGFKFQLDSVKITLAWTATGNVTVNNNDTVATHGFTAGTASIPLSILGPDGTPLAVTAVAGPFGSATSTPNSSFDPNTLVTSTPGAFGQDVPKAKNFCPPGPCVVPGSATYNGISGASSTFTFVNPLNLATYEGFGNVNLSFGASAQGGTYGGTEVGGSGHLFFGGTATAGGVVTVLYTYSEVLSGVPEPGVSLLVGGGLMALAFIARKRVRRA